MAAIPLLIVFLRHPAVAGHRPDRRRGQGLTPVRDTARGDRWPRSSSTRSTSCTRTASTRSRTYRSTSPTASSWSWSDRPAAASPPRCGWSPGLEDISTGELRIGGRRVNDVDPQGRDIAMVFQSYALYPHMSVADNIAYGLKLRKMPKDEIERADQQGRRHARADPAAGPQAQAALRRPAAAGGDGPLDRPRAPGLPDGRAAVQPRRQAAGADAGRDLRGRPLAQHHHPVRHPRPDRGHDDGRPDGRDEGRPAAAARHAQRVLRHPATTSSSPSSSARRR